MSSIINKFKNSKELIEKRITNLNTHRDNQYNSKNVDTYNKTLKNSRKFYYNISKI